GDGSECAVITQSYVHIVMDSDMDSSHDTSRELPVQVLRDQSDVISIGIDAPGQFRSRGHAETIGQIKVQQCRNLDIFHLPGGTHRNDPGQQAYCSTSSAVTGLEGQSEFFGRPDPDVGTEVIGHYRIVIENGQVIKGRIIEVGQADSTAQSVLQVALGV